MNIKTEKNRSSRASKRIKVGMQVVLISGYKSYRGKTFKVLSINGEYVTLDGFKKKKRATKISEENQQNFIEKDILVHISNVRYYDEDKKSQSKLIAKFSDGKKEIFSKKSDTKVS